MQFFERVRPQSWHEVVGQDKAIRQINAIRTRDGSLGGHAFFLTGQSGTGKTTLAKLIAAEVADDWAIVELDDGALLKSEHCDAMAREKHYRPVGKGLCWIINEAHGLRGAMIRRLLGILEGMPEWLTVIFTTTCDGESKLFEDFDDSSPLMSRCECVALSRRDLTTPFAARLVAVAREFGILNGHPNDFYLPAAVRILKEERNNLRMALGRVNELAAA